MFHIKRVYETAAHTDGCRVLVDRLWPRGLTKEKAALDEWLKDVAPSPELRQWFGHEPQRFDEFTVRYKAELDANSAAVQQLRHLEARHGTVCLLYAAHDSLVNHAQVLMAYLTES